MEVKFKIGDYVRAIGSVAGYSNLIGKAGKVVHIESGYESIGVEFFEEFFNGHDCQAHGKPGYCRYGSETIFEYDRAVDLKDIEILKPISNTTYISKYKEKLYFLKLKKKYKDNLYISLKGIFIGHQFISIRGIFVDDNIIKEI